MVRVGVGDVVMHQRDWGLQPHHHAMMMVMVVMMMQACKFVRGIALYKSYYYLFFIMMMVMMAVLHGDGRHLTTML